MISQHNGVDAFHSANGRHSFSAACLCVIGGKVALDVVIIQR